MKRLLLVLAACRAAVAARAARVGRRARAHGDGRAGRGRRSRAADRRAAARRAPRSCACRAPTRGSSPIRWMAEDGAAVKAGERVLEFDNSAVHATARGEEARRSSRREMRVRHVRGRQRARDARASSSSSTARKIALAKAQGARERAGGPAAGARRRRSASSSSSARETAVEKAEKELASAKAAADARAQGQADRARQGEARRSTNAEKAIDELVLNAPRDGIVVIGDHPWEGRKFQVGDTVQPGWTIVDDAGLSRRHGSARASCRDVDDGRVSVGMTGTCTLDAYPADAAAVHGEGPDAGRDRRGRQSLRRGFAVVLTLDEGRSRHDAAGHGGEGRAAARPRCRRSSCRAVRCSLRRGASARVQLAMARCATSSSARATRRAAP